jgi:calcineurin-like phosphoesterase family protein
VTIFFMGDPHFGHAVLTDPVKGEKKRAAAFSSVEEMNETLVARWNGRVRPSDTGIIVGDVAMNKRFAVEFVPRLNGRKFLIGGNHDEEKSGFYHGIGFESVFGCRKIDGFMVTHIPIAPWSMGRFRANIHGHCHSNTPKVYRKIDPATFLPAFTYVNVSAERTDYTPVSLEEINAWLR